MSNSALIIDAAQSGAHRGFGGLEPSALQYAISVTSRGILAGERRA